jgi:hypothetical protein
VIMKLSAIIGEREPRLLFNRYSITRSSLNQVTFFIHASKIKKSEKSSNEKGKSKKHRISHQKVKPISPKSVQRGYQICRLACPHYPWRHIF